MLLNTILAVLTILHAFVTILLPAVHMDDVFALRYNQLSRLNILTAIGTDATLHILFGHIFLIIFRFKALRLEEWHQHLHHEEEENNGQEGYK